MVTGPTSRHPEDDLLADLVADALPVDTARAVEAHVLTCQECASLLADAEHVRGLLARQDPGPLPDGMRIRIETALRSEAQGHSAPTTGVIARQTPPSPPISAPTTWSDTDSIEAYRSVMDRAPAPDPAADAFPERAAEPESHSRFGAVRGGFSHKGPRLSRTARAPSRSRRDIRQEDEDLRSGRRGLTIAGVAGVILVVALSAFAVKGFFWSSSIETEAGDAGTSLNLSGSGSRVVTTGTSYTETALPEQAHELMQLVAAANSAQSGTAEATASIEAGTASLNGPANGNLSLRDPTQLEGCLTALHAGTKEPLAVDLATYDGQEAAIIVLLGEGGGYEVWVVARTCSASSDETMRFLQLPA